MAITAVSSLDNNNCHYSVGMGKTIDELYTAAESGNDAELSGKNQIRPLLFRPIPPGGYTALHIAAYYGRKIFVKKLLALYDHEGSVDLEDRHNFLKVGDAYKNNTALHEAVRGGDHHEIVQLILGADPTLADNRNNEDESPLFTAAENGHLQSVKELLPWTHPPYGRSDGRTPLHQAMYSHHYEVVKQLSENHELVKAEDIEGWTVLHVAALTHGCPEEIVKQLLEPDISLCYKKDNINQQTALHIAATEGNLRFVRCILKIARRSAEIVDKDGRHALHLAVKNDHFNTMKELLKSMPRRSAEMVDKHGRHALHLAVERGNLRIVIMTLLKSRRRLINVPDSNGFTALDIAIAQQRVAGVAEIFNFMFVTWMLRSCNGIRGVRKDRELQERELQEREQRQFGQINTLSVVAVLIATVSFQAVIQPPGLASKSASALPFFITANDTAFYLSTLAAFVLVVSVIFPSLLWRNIGIGVSYYFVAMALYSMINTFITAQYAL